MDESLCKWCDLLDQKGVNMYIKGYDKGSFRRFFGRKFDTLQQDEFFIHSKEPYIIEIQYIDEPGLNRYVNMKDFEKHHYLAREISEEEFLLYKTIQTLTNEFFMNQITGGFPRRESIFHMSRDMVRRTKEAYNKTTDITVVEAVANAISDSLKEEDA